MMPEKDEDKNMPFSSRHYRECLEVGAKKFGWEKRTPASARCGATARFLAGVWPAQVGSRCGCPAPRQVEFHANGRVSVRSGTQDIGTGTYTIFAQVVHEKTGVPLDRIDVVLGDSALPDGPMSGGSMVTGSVLNAIAAGIDRSDEEDDSRSPPARKALR